LSDDLRRRAGLCRAFALASSLAALALLAAGCGLGAGKAPSAIKLVVTRDFGGSVLRSWSAPNAHGEETVMSLLARNGQVSTRYGGGFVQSIDGLSGGREQGQPVDWFYYVNGIEAPKGAASTVVHPGDHIWWDRHDWSQTEGIPAVVGSYPEPFLNGFEGKRLPVRVECTTVGSVACRVVAGRLRAAGVPAAISGLNSGFGALHTLRVEVGPFVTLANDPAARELATGPRASGVYGRFEAGGRSLALLDRDGRSVQRLGAGAGLIAATRVGEEAPVWLVTGTDADGATAAARAFDAATLNDRFAVAVAPAGPLALPRPGSS
jgi:hypothetical protein